MHAGEEHGLRMTLGTKLVIEKFSLGRGSPNVCRPGVMKQRLDFLISPPCDSENRLSSVRRQHVQGYRSLMYCLQRARTRELQSYKKLTAATLVHLNIVWQPNRNAQNVDGRMLSPMRAYAMTVNAKY